MISIQVVDFETTGMEPPAEVVEVGLCSVDKAEGGAWAVGDPRSYLCGVSSIPPEVRAIHHISLSEVAGLQPFDAAEFLKGRGDWTAVAAHNWDFEAKWLTPALTEKLPTICTYKAALRVWPDAPSHSNGALRYWLQDQGLIDPDQAKTMPPHRAGPDAYVTANILKALLDTGTTGRDMIAWTREPRMLPTCPLGKWRGKPWADVDSGFLNWMLKTVDMEFDLKWNAQRELDRRAA